MEGLHLINFDPSSVKANKEAIIEYNRLKQMYKPDTEIIPVLKKKYCKIEDVLSREKMKYI